MSIWDTLAERFSTSLIRYYHLWEYIDRLGTHFLANRSSHAPTSCRSFYAAVRDGSIKPGDRICLKNYFLTEWIPRAPGACAFLASQVNSSDAWMYDKYPSRYDCWSSEVKSATRWSLAVGSCRLPAVPNRPIALGAVTANEYLTDYGIVLLVTGSVYEEFLSHQLGHNAVEATVNGFVEVVDYSPQLADGGLGFTVPPRMVVRVESPLQVTFRYHSSHPPLNSWVMRRVVYDGDNAHGIRSGEKASPEYEFLHLCIPSSEPEELFRARDIIRQWVPYDASNSVLTSTVSLSALEHAKANKFDEKLKWYTIGDIEYLTEFDSRHPLIDPLIPLRIDPRQVKHHWQTLTSHLQALESLERAE